MHLRKPAAALRKLAEEHASWLRLPREVWAVTKRLKMPLPVSCSSRAATAAWSCATLAGTSPLSVSGSETEVCSILRKPSILPLSFRGDHGLKDICQCLGDPCARRAIGSWLFHKEGGADPDLRSIAKAGTRWRLRARMQSRLSIMPRARATPINAVIACVPVKNTIVSLPVLWTKYATPLHQHYRHTLQDSCFSQLLSTQGAQLGQQIDSHPLKLLQ